MKILLILILLIPALISAQGVYVTPQARSTTAQTCDACVSVQASASANTYGSWAEITSATTAQANSYDFRCSGTQKATTVQRVTVNIGTGAGAAEVVKQLFMNIAPLDYTGAAFDQIIFQSGPQLVTIPISTRVAIRVKSASASTPSCEVQGTLFETRLDPMQQLWKSLMGLLYITSAEAAAEEKWYAIILTQDWDEPLPGENPNHQLWHAGDLYSITSVVAKNIPPHFKAVELDHKPDIKEEMWNTADKVFVSK